MSDLEEPESVTPTNSTENAYDEQAIRAWFGKIPFPKENSPATKKLVRRMHQAKWMGRFATLAFVLVLCTPFWNSTSLSILVVLLGGPWIIVRRYIAYREHLRSLVKANDICAIPALLDYLQSKEILEDKEALVPIADLTRLLFAMKPEQATCFTPSHLKYFHSVLIREFKAPYRLNYQDDTSPELRDYYDYWHTCLCIAILNFLPYIGNTETLLLLKRLENIPPRSHRQADVLASITRKIPYVLERVQQTLEHGTLLRPADIEAERELLRPLSTSPKEESELLLRGNYDNEKGEE